MASCSITLTRGASGMDTLKPELPSYLAQPKLHELAWVANGDKPIPYPFTGVLTLEEMNSTLKITRNGTGNPIQLYTAPQAYTNINTSNVVATPLDSGNFVPHEVNLESIKTDQQ
ncbi:hypothetical protein GBA52_020392 [Prunus armeniaca]|nr:hypothetical protein GBA52_020392 [Prunus armeniaca]